MTRSYLRSKPAMTTWNLPAAAPHPAALLRSVWRENKPLTLIGVLMLLTLAGTLVGILVDPRVITGMPAWVKPAKFAISLAIYAFTFLWLLTFVKGRRRLVAVATYVTAITATIEMVIIAGQAMRGVNSHFNTATSLDGMLFSIMGGAIVLLWLAGLLLAGLLLFQRLPNPVLAWGLRLGMLVALVGMGLAFLMTSQVTPAQAAALAEGRPALTSGGHSFGVADGGAGLPFVGWSTEGGDLRVAHFFGLHAMQALPLFVWLLLRFAPQLGMRRQVALVWTAGLLYLGLTLLLAWQALREQPLIAPDGLTLAALAGLLAGTGIAALLIVRGRGQVS
jgi:hypothetical protein